MVKTIQSAQSISIKWLKMIVVTIIVWYMKSIHENVHKREMNGSACTLSWIRLHIPYQTSRSNLDGSSKKINSTGG